MGVRKIYFKITMIENKYLEKTPLKMRWENFLEQSYERMTTVVDDRSENNNFKRNYDETD